jgi:hypothetical protein
LSGGCSKSRQSSKSFTRPVISGRRSVRDGGLGKECDNEERGRQTAESQRIFHFVPL